MREDATETIKKMLNEVVKKYMNESINEKDEREADDVTADELGDAIDGEEKEEEVPSIDSTEDVSDDNVDNTELPSDSELGGETMDTADELESPEETGDDDWAEFDKYKNNDGEYDFSTMEDGENAVKVFKLLNDEDEVVVKKDGDVINIKDNETGSEYVVQLGDGIADVEEQAEENFVSNGEDVDETLYEVDLSKLGKVIAESIGGMASCDLKGTQKESKEEDETLTEEDVVEDENPIDENGTKTKQNSTKMTLKPNKGQRLPMGAPKRGPGLQAEDILRKLKTIEEENNTLKNALVKFKGALQEAALLNVNLGQIVKLIGENTTSKEEKVEIIQRFDKEAKTIAQSKQLYESIKHGLNKKGVPTIVAEKQFTKTANVSENKVYQAQGAAHIISLMDRIGNIGKE